jgi:hypothetical protein
VNNPYISKAHFEIYSVVYEEDNTEYQPLIYVRDRQSLSGTSVNGRIIGSKAHGVTPGYLLSQGDIINIKPFWEFFVTLQDQDGWKFPLNQVQHIETQVVHDASILACAELLTHQRLSMTDTASLIES